MAVASPLNVIVIVSDTLRRDHLGCYGNPRVLTPFLDQFSDKCVVFDRCYAASFATMPARADLLTGNYAFSRLAWGPLPREEKLVTQFLQETDYRSMGVVDTPFFLRNGYGFDRGFDDFKWIKGQSFFTLEQEEHLHERRYEEDYFAPQTMREAAKWLERHYQEKFFLYVDTWDPHEPWDPPAYYVEPFYQGYDGRVVDPCYWYWREKGYTEDDLEVAHACYCGEIRMMDRWVGHLLESIELMGLMDNTAIIFTADHGYYFGEHGIFGKAMMRNWRPGYAGDEILRSSIYDEVARIPLLVYVPGVAPRRTDALVNMPDLMPTIMKLCGEEPPAGIHGQSLLPILEGEDKGRDFVVTSRPYHLPGEMVYEITAKTTRVADPVPSSINTHEWTLICSYQDEPVELYHTPTDPGQTKNVYKDNRQVADELHRAFYQFLTDLGVAKKHLEPRANLSPIPLT